MHFRQSGNPRASCRSRTRWTPTGRLTRARAAGRNLHEDDGLSAVDDHDRYEGMHQALAHSLSPARREIIRLRYGLGLPGPMLTGDRQAARDLTAIVSRIEKRALEKLRDALKQA